MPLDDTTVRVYAIVFVAITAVLVYTARFFHARRSRRAMHHGGAAGFERMPDWIGQGIETGRPLHLGFGSAAIGSETTPIAAAEAEFFYHIIRTTKDSDSAPLVSTSSAATVPLAQDTIRRAWEGDPQWNQAQWYPQGERSLAYAAGVSAMMGVEEPAAHVLAGSFGPELALMLNSADQLGQGTLAVSDQLDGQAIAFAMADEVLIGEQMFSAAAHLTSETTALADARVTDVWRGLLIMGLSILLLINFSAQLAIVSWTMVLAVALGLLVIGALLFRRS